MLGGCLQAGALCALLAGTGAAVPARARGPRRRGHAGRASSPGRLWFGLGFLVPVSAWVLFSLARGAPLFSQLHHNIAYEVFARAKGISRDDYQTTLLYQFHSLGDVNRPRPGSGRQPRALQPP